MNEPAAKTPQQSIGRTYQIVTNLSCNLDCTYCYERKYARNNKAEDIVDFLHACFERDAALEGADAIIDIIGGEPFMQPKLLITAFETAEELAKKYKRPYVFSISTNGTLFDKEINRGIIERWKRVLAVGVSIDGLQEQHDKYRIYTNTRMGSYDKVIEGYNYLKGVGLREIGVKATFTLETLPYFAAGMKHLIDITGGGTVSGNVTFEDVMPRDMAPGIAAQMIDIIEHFESKGLHRFSSNTLGHLLPTALNFEKLWSPDYREELLSNDKVRLVEDRTRAFCGSTVYMTCLGFDRKVYGCNRFMSTVTTRNAYGLLVGREIVVTDDNRLLKEIENQYKDYPDACMSCPLKPACGSCAAGAYEHKDGGDAARKEYHAEERQCGWTLAKLMVAAWYYRRHRTYDHHDLHVACGCNLCRDNTDKCGSNHAE